MRIVDAKGQPCPAPLIATKRALKETRTGESFQVLIDNQTSLNNVSRFLKDNNTTFLVGESEGVWTLTIENRSGEAPGVSAEDYCTPAVPHFKKGDFIVVITSDRMGDGDDELGHLLMNNFIRALMDLDKLPQKMVFYNKGVTLLANESDCITHLKDLEKMGVEILLCATCTGHYGLNDKIGAGILSNMFTIAEAMSTAGKIIRP
jgi:selenium metabolism protein YedF